MLAAHGPAPVLADGATCSLPRSESQALPAHRYGRRSSGAHLGPAGTKDPRVGRSALPGARRPSGDWTQEETGRRPPFPDRGRRPRRPPARERPDRCAGGDVDRGRRRHAPARPACRAPAAMNGSAMGTAAVVLVVAVPLLVRVGRAYQERVAAVPGGLDRQRRVPRLQRCSLLLRHALQPRLPHLRRDAGSGRLDAGAAVARSWDVRVDGTRVPARGIAAFLWVVVVLNGGRLAGADPPGPRGRPSCRVPGRHGHDTNPIFVQDLAFWLPAMAWLGWALWQRRDRGSSWPRPARLLAARGGRSGRRPVVGTPPRPRLLVVSLAGSVGFV